MAHREGEQVKAQIAEEIARTCVQTFLRFKPLQSSNPFSSAAAAAAAARLQEAQEAHILKSPLWCLA